LAPEQPGASPSLETAKTTSKAEWLTEWLGSGRRAASQTVLYAFRDMDKFAVWEPIKWVPPSGGPKDLPNIVIVPRGFVTDLASVPSYFWWLVQPTGRHGHAAILHDWLYWEQKGTRDLADRVFDVAMGELGVAAALRTTMWAAVRVYGGTYWSAAAEERRSGASRVLCELPASSQVSWEEWRKRPGVFEPTP
jgi:hypothetical protein